MNKCHQVQLQPSKAPVWLMANPFHFVAFFFPLFPFIPTCDLLFICIAFCPFPSLYFILSLSQSLSLSHFSLLVTLYFSFSSFSFSLAFALCFCGLVAETHVHSFVVPFFHSPSTTFANAFIKRAATITAYKELQPTTDLGYLLPFIHLSSFCLLLHPFASVIRIKAIHVTLLSPLCCHPFPAWLTLA